MGKNRNGPNKSLQLYEEGTERTTTGSSKVQETKLKNAIQQVFLQQSVTILAFKDKSKSNGTASPDILEPKLFLGLLSEDIPVFVGAIIGAALIIALFLMILTFWKCCCRMQIIKKKKYWLNSKDKGNSRKKHSIPSVVQSNSVVFLGLKPTQVYDCHKMDKSLEECSLPKLSSFPEKEELNCTRGSYSEPPHIVMSAPCPEVRTTEYPNSIKPASLPNSSIPAHTVPIEPTYVNCETIKQNLELPNLQAKEPSVISPSKMNIPSVIIQCDDSLQSSPAIFHRTYYSGTFDQHSLYSYASYLGSEIDLKTCSLTWSNYNLRPSSTGDCYNDLFQRASLCKKRKNRMRSDIAAAIAMNRSQSTQLNKEKDTDSLVENEVEIVLDERTTL